MSTKDECHFRKEESIKDVLGCTFWKVARKLEVGFLEQQEELEKKQRAISLKAKIESSKGPYDEDSEEDDNENMTLLVKEFGKFLRRNQVKSRSL